MKEANYLRNQIRQFRKKCPVETCKKKCRVIDALAINENKVRLFFDCFDHGQFKINKSFKSLMK